MMAIRARQAAILSRNVVRNNASLVCPPKLWSNSNLLRLRPASIIRELFSNNNNNRCFSTDTIESSTGDEQPVDALLQETNRIIGMLGGDSSSSMVEQKSIDALMEQWVERKSGAHQAKSLLDAMDSPDTGTYNFVLQAYATSGKRAAAEAAQQLLNDMMETCRHRQQQHPTTAAAPSTRSFNIVMNAWAKSRDQDAGTKAEECFTIMEDWLQECRQTLKLLPLAAPPNGRTLTAVMDAWAQSKAVDAAERVMAILEVAIERHKQQQQAEADDLISIMKPDVVMFNTAIHAWATSGKGQFGAEKAEHVLKLLQELNESGALGQRDEHDDENDAGLVPNTRSYSLLINAWAEHQGGAERAEQILNQMIARYRDSGNDSAKPNTTTFTTCIKAWSKERGRDDFAQRAQNLYNQLADLYRETKDDDFKPNAWTGNLLLSAWAKHAAYHHNGNTNTTIADPARELLETMREFCEPDLVSYNTVLDAYAKSRNGRKAIMLLNEMEQQQQSNNIQPDVVSYNTTLSAMSKDKMLSSEAPALLDRMLADGAITVKPDKFTYTSVIQAWANSRNTREDNAGHAQKILNLMLQQYYQEGNKSVKPDVHTFTSTINACANAHGNATTKRGALKYAIKTLEQMKQSKDLDNPNQMTYSAMMRACSRLCGGRNERTRLLEHLFQQCLGDGMVSRQVIEIIVHGVPYKVKEKYGLGTKNPAVPRAWCAKVPSHSKPPIL